MFRQATETYILWVLILLGFGVAVSLLAGLVELGRARNLPFFLLRRQAMERGWRNIVIGIFFLLLGLAVLIGGKPLVEMAVPPTITPTISPTPSVTPTVTLTPTITLTPSNTLPPTDTLTPSPTLTPSETATPGYPYDLITNIPEGTVTPNPDAVIGLITVAPDQTDKGQPIGAAFEFDASTLTQLLAMYTYDNMTNGVQSSTIWYRDGVPIYIDTALWVGGTGGPAVDECPLEQCQFLPGNYRVAVFVGDQLKRFADFVITGTPPTRTLTPSNTPSPSATFTATSTPTITNTATVTGTNTATFTASPRPTQTNTPSRTATFTRTFTATATNTPLPSATPTFTRTPSVTPTRTVTNTIPPIFLTDYARTAEAQTATAQAGAP
jgi:hypothetical protein